MRAGRAFEVKHVRGGVAPAVLAAPDRVDHVEIVEIDSGEVVLLWDLAPGGRERVVRWRPTWSASRPGRFIAAWRARTQPSMSRRSSHVARERGSIDSGPRTAA